MWSLFLKLPNKSRRKPALPAPSYSSPRNINKTKHRITSLDHHALYSLFSVSSVFPTTMKKKNKLLLCFRPLTHDPPPRDSDSVLLSNHKNTETSKLKSDQEALRVTQRRSRSLNASSRNLCGDLKSVLVEASLHQQKQPSVKGNAARLMLRSKSHHDSINLSKSLGSIEDNCVSLSSSAIPETERRTSSPLSQSKTLAKSQIHADANARSLNSGLFVFLMSLWATIFCGRICAILFTLIFVYCMPRRTWGDRRLKSVENLPEETEKECKKRVIMEGLLERNHHSCRGKVIS
uniref:Uncharacterized protein n=2 Tax=Daucus carota subsp. sativus TaxID=79200 RepID=A0A162AH16_DAUCS|nr:PREDICTED: uncharacterized protein LOC108212200 [Daucus carota subsp. sativus]